MAESTKIEFIFWRHFSFGNTFDYAGCYFVDGNSYEIDRTFITGEFIRRDGEKFETTFGLSIDEIIPILDETAEIKWRHVPSNNH